MIHIAVFLSIWLLFISVVVQTTNIRSKLVFNLPAIVFAFIVAFWYVKQVGLV